MKKYLSYGGGVNSTALMILLKNQGVKFEAVFSDHGGDYPETYDYVRMLQENGYPITVLDCKVEGLDLYNYSLKYKILPSRWMRWCTDKFKITPLYSYFVKPCVVYIGFHSDERKRAKVSRDLDIYNEFPLIENNIDQKGCEKIILDVGLAVPRKSGCYFCPFASRKEFEYIRDNKHDLWCKMKTLENSAINRRKEQGKTPIYLRDKPLDAVVSEGQFDLWGLRKPCQCGI